MKILVLGNGFDLDHNLPTSYINFLNFCVYVLHGNSFGKNYFEKLTETQKSYIKKLQKNKQLHNEFTSLLENNYLFRYFYFQIEFQGENWIDLEREIKSITYEFKSIEEEYNSSKQYRYSASVEHKIHELVERLGLKEVDSGKINENTLNYIHKVLQKSLNDFSKALELYIVNFINTTYITGVSPDIIDFDATNVLTFNYSKTYERVYSGVHWGEVIDHIHGTAQKDLKAETNIVLGITSADGQSINRYVDFEKYFQRITKKTGNKYKEWLNSKTANNQPIEVAFFGHSLDSSDSDIINDLICSEDTIVTIYYYDEKAHKDIVANLVEIIGKQKLIKYVSGKKPKISFIKQHEHQHNNTAGVEIERDVRKLYKLYSLKSQEINKLLEKINKRVTFKNLSYFYTQRKTIDLFEALRYIGIEKYDIRTFFDFCKCLDFEITKTGNLKQYHNFDWSGETPWGETIECHKDTKKLIALVNDSNKKRFEDKRAQEPYANVISIKTIPELKTALINIFKKESTPTYWKELNNLMNSMVESKILSKALGEILTENHNISILSKAKHFEMAYMETVYDYQLAKEWEEDKKAQNKDK